MSLASSKNSILSNKKQLSLFVGFLVLLFAVNNWLLHTQGWTRFFGGITFYLLLYLIFRLWGLRLKDIGLSKERIKPGALLAVKIIGIYSIFLLLVFTFADSVFRDPRYDHPLGTAIYAALFVLPLKTVLFEEIIFRGMLPAMVKTWSSQSLAIITSSILFGLWHLTTALDIRGATVLQGHTVPAGIILFGVFLATSLAGYALCYLRYKSKSLVTPIALHWFINGSAVVLAALAW